MGGIGGMGSLDPSLSVGTETPHADVCANVLGLLSSRRQSKRAWELERPASVIPTHAVRVCTAIAAMHPVGTLRSSPRGLKIERLTTYQIRM
jgi:hypothetical protein